MNKPMYCPMSYGNLFAERTPEECTPDCAWAVTYNGEYHCVVANICGAAKMNTRPLEDDAE